MRIALFKRNLSRRSVRALVYNKLNQLMKNEYIRRLHNKGIFEKDGVRIETLSHSDLKLLLVKSEFKGFL